MPVTMTVYINLRLSQPFMSFKAKNCFVSTDTWQKLKHYTGFRIHVICHTKTEEATQIPSKCHNKFQMMFMNWTKYTVLCFCLRYLQEHKSWQNVSTNVVNHFYCIFTIWSLKLFIYQRQFKHTHKKLTTVSKQKKIKQK
jgi:hypothetical protein